MIRKTPLETAIAEKTEPKARYRKAMRDKGYVQFSRWVPAAAVADLDAALAKLRAIYDPE